MSVLALYGRTQPTGDLFDWQAGVNGFTFCGVPDILVSEPVGEGDDSYQHHAIIKNYYGKKWIARTSADYDEEQPSMHTVLKYSDDGGETWSSKIEVLPEMCPNVRRTGNVGRINYPTAFIPIDGQLYVLSEVDDRDFTGGNARTPIGVLLTPVDSDGSIGTPVWVHNADEVHYSPRPFSDSYPKYNYDFSQRLKVLEYINRPNFFPKILFSWGSVWSVTDEFEGDGLGEPESIKPIGSNTWFKYWKSGAPGYKNNKVGQIGENGSFFNSSVPEDDNSTVMRILNYSKDVIILCGNADYASSREELFFAAAIRQTDGTYQINGSKVLGVSNSTVTTQTYTGHGKGGGEQLPHMELLPDGTIDLVFDIAKESVYYKNLNPRTLFSL